MNIEKLFSGIAVIIDNEINDRSSSIYRIKELIEEKSIPVLTFPEIPSQEVFEEILSWLRGVLLCLVLLLSFLIGTIQMEKFLLRKANGYSFLGHSLKQKNPG